MTLWIVLGSVVAVVLGIAWLMGVRDRRMLSREGGSEYDEAWLNLPHHDGGAGPLP